MHNCSDNLISDNVVAFAAGSGISLIGSSNRNKVIGNLTNGSTNGYGIFMQGDYNTVDWNTASNNSSGINISGNGNVYSNNRAVGNTANGIVVAPGQFDAGGNIQ
jgi:parallel beta-helix repeat protein